METSLTAEPGLVSNRPPVRSAGPERLRRCFLLGLPFDRVTLGEAVDECLRAMKEGKPRFVATPNVDFTRCAAANPDLGSFLMASWCNTCDGLPLVWLSRLLGEGLPERVAGSDLTPRLLERCAREGFGVFFLGSDAETLREVAETLEDRFPGIDIRGWHAPPFGPVSDWDHPTILAKLSSARPDLVLVATGSPKQEEWIARYQDAAGIPLCIGVGASLDFITGKQVRAPQWIQRIGMEWFWRLSGSPKRLAGRYAADFAFFFRVAFRQWRLHRFWKKPHSASPVPVSGPWSVLDVAEWLRSESDGGSFPEGPLLLDVSRMESFDHRSFNRFAEAAIRHRREGRECVLWNPPALLVNVIEGFGWRALLPSVRTGSEARDLFEPSAESGASEQFRVLLSAGMVQGGRSGVGRYVIELARELSSDDSEVELYIAGLDSDRHLFPQIPDDRWVRIPGWAAGGALNFIWHQVGLRLRIRKGGYDLVHIPSYRRIIWRCPVPQVATIHDCAPFELEDKYDALRGWFGRRLVPILARKCDHVISVSQTSADAVVKFMGVEKEKVSAIPNGIDHQRYFVKPAGDIETFLAERGEAPGGYFLYVARLEHPGKNHLRLIEALEQYRKRNPKDPVRVLLAGADWHGSEEIHARIANSGARESIRCLGYVPDEELPLWYGGARAMVMPTLFEGFGLPVAEALACGTLVACSDLPVLREVGGKAVTCFDLEDPGAICRAMEAVAEYAGPDRDSRIRAGLDRAARFDWKRTAESVSKIHRETAQKKGYENY